MISLKLRRLSSTGVAILDKSFTPGLIRLWFGCASGLGRELEAGWGADEGGCFGRADGVGEWKGCDCRRWVEDGGAGEGARWWRAWMDERWWER